MKCSVVIATYGDDSWEALAIERALPSVQAQEPFEILVGHDPDATIAGVRNELANKAKGDWLCFVDADDDIAPGYFVAMEGAEKKNRLSSVLLTPAVSYVHGGKRRTPTFHPIGNFESDNYIVIGTLVKRDLFEQVGGFNDYPHGFEDWSLWAKCWKSGAQVVQVRRAVYYAFVNPASKHRQGWRDRNWQVEMHKKVAAELEAWTP